MRKLDTCENIFNRMCRITDSKNGVEFAEKMGKSKQAVYQALRKDTLPPSWPIEVACLKGCSVDWLLFGDNANLVPPDKVLVDKELFEKIALILGEIEMSEM